MDHIINIAHQRTKEVSMAKARIAQPIQEVAQIQWQYTGCDTTNIVRYHDMRAAQKQFVDLVDAMNKGREYTLKGPAATCLIRFPQNIVNVFLIAVETNNFLMGDTQKRMNAYMQLP